VNINARTRRRACKDQQNRDDARGTATPEVARSRLVFRALEYRRRALDGWILILVRDSSNMCSYR
jgi:hypothetical protein